MLAFTEKPTSHHIPGEQFLQLLQVTVVGNADALVESGAQSRHRPVLDKALTDATRQALGSKHNAGLCLRLVAGKI